jgi:hypothetical protein
MPDLGARLDAALDQYRIERKVGEGGMAVVFLAEDLKHSRQVALKVMKPDVGTSLGSERFLREIDIAAKLSHPHVLPLYDSGEVEGLHYIVMPYVEGESLRDSLLRKRPKRFRGDVAYALEGIPQTELRPPDALEDRQSPCVRAVRHRPVVGEEYDASSTFRTCEVDLLEGPVLGVQIGADARPKSCARSSSLATGAYEALEAIVVHRVRHWDGDIENALFEPARPILVPIAEGVVLIGEHRRRHHHPGAPRFDAPVDPPHQVGDVHTPELVPFAW